MNWLKHIAVQTSVILSLSFLIGITVISFLYPYLNQSDLNNAYHQNSALAKLPPLTQVKFLKVVQNTGNPSRLDRDPYRYEPFDHFEVIGDQVLIYHGEGFQQYHIVDVCYAVSDEQINA